MADPMSTNELGSEPRGFGAQSVDRAPLGLVLHSHDGETSDPVGPPEQLKATLLRLAASTQASGDYGETEALLGKALALTETTLGSDHPDLVLLLNDLTLLYLKQSNYTAAEPLLLRLLDIKRRKGENHPEVATVLGSLAATKRALGRHESAEGLLRRVLEIRERTLAPNHFLVATALEQLAEACEARGKLAEALRLFQRAYSVREITLGSEHPSMRACRERIADLQLQSPEASMSPVAAAGPVSTLYRYPLLGIERTESPPVAAVSSESRALVAGAIPASPMQDRVPYHDVLLGIEDEQGENSRGDSLADRVRGGVAPILEFLEQRQAAAIGTVVVLALGALGFTLLPSIGSDNQIGPPTFESGLSHPVALAAPASPREVSVSESTGGREIRNANTFGNSQPTVEHPRPVDKPATKNERAKKADAKNISIPSVSANLTSALDSVLARSSKTAPVAVDGLLATPAPPAFVSQRGNFGGAESNDRPQRARLIGELPTPRVPDQLVGVQGEVRVEFHVDPVGQPVMSTFTVVNSPNPMLTAAVRNVIPGMRFEPARSGGPDSKPVADVVQIWFQFASKRP